MTATTHIRRPRVASAWLGVVVTLGLSNVSNADAQDRSPSFSLRQVLGYPYPSELTAAATGSRVAWVFNERGVRNVWVAEGPAFAARRLTDYRADDGQELTNVSISRDGKTVVYVRGGDHDANWPVDENPAPDPASSPTRPQIEIWAVPFGGGTPKLLAGGDQPTISPRGDRVAFVRDHAIWTVALDGSSQAKQLFFARGDVGSPTWSPDGSRLAFVSDRGDHSFIGVFAGDSVPIRYLAPSTSRDFRPRWSPDGARIAFIRLPGEGGAPEIPLFADHPLRWSIWTGDASTGAARRVWESPRTPLGSYPTTDGETNLSWAANGRLIFLSDLDGWPHLYSIRTDGAGAPLLLTPGRFMVEFARLTPDGSSVLYAANAGRDRFDIDRRHIFRVPVDHAASVALTSGNGIEWGPVGTRDGSIVFVGAGPRTPPLPHVLAAGAGTGQGRAIAADRVPSDFPSASFVVPRSVTFRASDGLEVHGQLFEPAADGARHPALVFVHGGPPRQMLLGFHYMDYYSHAYAINQYFASRGYVVLALNYRLGIGYGHEFHHPAHAGPDGASEYQDVKAGGEFVRRLPGVDPARVGIWGGSYGGYLGALALARNSDIFAAAVDLHGVHDWTTDLASELARAETRYERGDVARAKATAWRSSPVASVGTWRSPVLLIHGDDDRNVRFHQTVDLARRLDTAGVPYEELVIPDEIHGFLRYATWLTVDAATTSYFDRILAHPVRRQPAALR